MPCTPFQTPDGLRGFICSRKRSAAPRCTADSCRMPSAFQCDYPVAPGKTCDRHLCSMHAHEAGHDVHYCPEHQALFKRIGAPTQDSFEF